MRRKIRMTTGNTSATRDDLWVGGRPPKRREPLPDRMILVYRVRDEPPPGWRPDGLPRPPSRT
jgi:hypothetical protein